MVKYKCPRCGYKAKQKGNLRDHYSRKNICDIIYEDISIEECMKILNEKKKPICEYCGKMYSRNDSLKRHKIICKSTNLQLLEKNKQMKEEIRELKDTITVINNNPYENKMEDNLEDNLEDKQGWVYLVHEREFIKTNEKVYKVGKTLKPKQRLSSYPKGSMVLFLSPCIDCDNLEKEILILFKDVFTKRDDIGNEYFEGNYMDMVSLILPKLIE